jgi:hypothetical protein
MIETPKQQDHTVGSEHEAWQRLAIHLGFAGAANLANALDEIVTNTGFGSVTLVLYEGKINQLKASTSHKWK